MRLAAIWIKGDRRRKPIMPANIQFAPMKNSFSQNSWILFRFKGPSLISILALVVCQPCCKNGRLLRRQSAACFRFKRGFAAVLAEKHRPKDAPWSLGYLANFEASLCRLGSLARLTNAFRCAASHHPNHQSEKWYNS